MSQDKVKIYSTEDGYSEVVSQDKLTEKLKVGAVAMLVVSGFIAPSVQGEFSVNGLADKTASLMINGEAKELKIREAFYPNHANVFEVDEAIESSMAFEQSFAMARNISYVEEVSDWSEGIILR